MSKGKDELKIPERWTFADKGVAKHFEAHVREQLPWYEWATEAVAFLARHFTVPKTLVYDFGCSTGNIGNAIEKLLTERDCIFHPVDESAEMLERYTGPGIPTCASLEDFDVKAHSVAISFLTLQFLPTHRRATVLNRIIANQLEGGALILVDKFLPTGANVEADTAIYRLTLDAKLAAGVPADKIVRKELSLAGTQRPLTHDLLKPYNSTPFFRYGHFEGWIITY